MQLPRIEAVFLSIGWVTIEGNVDLPIEAYFDGDGDDCEPGDARLIVFGCDETGYFQAHLGDDLLNPTIH